MQFLTSGLARDCPPGHIPEEVRRQSGCGCSSGPGLITGYGGHPTAYGSGLRAHLRSLAAG